MFERYHNPETRKPTPDDTNFGVPFMPPKYKTVQEWSEDFFAPNRMGDHLVAQVERRIRQRLGIETDADRQIRETYREPKLRANLTRLAPVANREGFRLTLQIAAAMRAKLEALLEDVWHWPVPAEDNRLTFDVGPESEAHVYAVTRLDGLTLVGQSLVFKATYGATYYETRAGLEDAVARLVTGRFKRGAPASVASPKASSVKAPAAPAQKGYDKQEPLSKVVKRLVPPLEFHMAMCDPYRARGAWMDAEGYAERNIGSIRDSYWEMFKASWPEKWNEPAFVRLRAEIIYAKNEPDWPRAIVSAELLDTFWRRLRDRIDENEKVRAPERKPYFAGMRFTNDSFSCVRGPDGRLERDKFANNEMYANYAVFADCDLRNISLRGSFHFADFRNVDLSDANISWNEGNEALFNGANLSRSEWWIEPRKIHRKLDFSHATMDAVKWSGCMLDQCQFTGCDLRTVDFQKITFMDCDFTDALLPPAFPASVRVQNCDFGDGLKSSKWPTVDISGRAVLSTSRKSNPACDAPDVDSEHDDTPDRIANARTFKHGGGANSWEATLVSPAATKALRAGRIFEQPPEHTDLRDYLARRQFGQYLTTEICTRIKARVGLLRKPAAEPDSVHLKTLVKQAFVSPTGSWPEMNSPLAKAVYDALLTRLVAIFSPYWGLLVPAKQIQVGGHPKTWNEMGSRPEDLPIQAVTRIDRIALGSFADSKFSVEATYGYGYYERTDLERQHKRAVDALAASEASAEAPAPVESVTPAPTGRKSSAPPAEQPQATDGLKSSRKPTFSISPAMQDVVARLDPPFEFWYAYMHSYRVRSNESLEVQVRTNAQIIKQRHRELFPNSSWKGNKWDATLDQLLRCLLDPNFLHKDANRYVVTADLLDVFCMKAYILRLRGTPIVPDFSGMRFVDASFASWRNSEGTFTPEGQQQTGDVIVDLVAERADFSGCNLTGLRLRGALTEARFDDAQMQWCKLTFTVPTQRVSFVRTNLTGATVRFAPDEYADGALTHEGMSFLGAILNKTLLQSGHILLSSFSKADLRGVKIDQGMRFERCMFLYTLLPETDRAILSASSVYWTPPAVKDCTFWLDENGKRVRINRWPSQQEAQTEQAKADAAEELENAQYAQATSDVLEARLSNPRSAAIPRQPKVTEPLWFCVTEDGRRVAVRTEGGEWLIPPPENERLIVASVVTDGVAVASFPMVDAYGRLPKVSANLNEEHALYRMANPKKEKKPPAPVTFPPIDLNIAPHELGDLTGYDVFAAANAQKIRQKALSWLPFRAALTYGILTKNTGIEQANGALRNVGNLLAAPAFLAEDDLAERIRQTGMQYQRAADIAAADKWSQRLTIDPPRLLDAHMLRYVCYVTGLTNGVALPKVSFALSLIGHDLPCLDTRILQVVYGDNVEAAERALTALNAKDDHGSGSLAGARLLKRVDAVDAYLHECRRIFDRFAFMPSDAPFYMARSQWALWERSPAERRGKPAVAELHTHEEFAEIIDALE